MIRVRKPRRALALAVLTATMIGSTVLSVGPASADNPTSSYSFGEQYGPKVRAYLFQHGDSQGFRIRMFGSRNCTPTYSDSDLSMGTMPAGWNDAVSSAKDYIGCDINLYSDNLSSLSTGYRNYGSGGASVPSGWNDRTSAVRLS